MSCGCSECNKKYGGIPRPPLSYKAGGKSPKASMSCGQVKRSTRPGKKIMKLYCIDGKKKLVHAGAKGYGHNYSAAARKSFKARHKCSTAKPGTAKHLACTELWAGKGGSKKSSPKGRKGKYADGGPHSVPPDLFSETLATQQAPKQAPIAPATPLMSFSMDSSAPAPSIYNTGNQGPSSLAEVPNSVMYSRGPRGVNFTVQTGMKGKTPTYTTIPFSALQNSLNDPSFFTGDDAGYYREFAIKQLQKGMPLTLDEKGRASIPFTSAQKRAFSGPSEEQYDEVLSSDEYLQAFLNKAEDPGALKQTKYRTAKVGPRTGGMQVNLLDLPKISPCPPGTLHCPGFAAGGYRNNYAVGGPYLNINPYNPLNESDFDVLYKNKGQGEMDLSKRQQRRISRRQTGRNIGATAYGVLEGLVDTISFGATDALTDKGYEALAGLGREQSESRKKQSARYRGAGQAVGATAGAILTGGTATGSAIGTTDYDLFANEGPKSLQTGLKVAGTVVGVAVGNTSGVEGTGGALGGTAVGDISANLSKTSSFGGTGTGFENLAQTYAPNFKDGIDGFKEFQESNPEGTLGEFLQQNPEILQKALEGLGMGSGAQVSKYGGPISYRAGGRRYPHGGPHPPTDPPKTGKKVVSSPLTYTPYTAEASSTNVVMPGVDAQIQQLDRDAALAESQGVTLQEVGQQRVAAQEAEAKRKQEEEFRQYVSDYIKITNPDISDKDLDAQIQEVRRTGQLPQTLVDRQDYKSSIFDGSSLGKYKAYSTDKVSLATDPDIRAREVDFMRKYGTEPASVNAFSGLLSPFSTAYAMQPGISEAEYQERAANTPALLQAADLVVPGGAAVKGAKYAPSVMRAGVRGLTNTGNIARRYLNAPLTVGSRTIPYVTAGDAIGAGFATRGAYNLGTDLDSGFYSDPSIPASQKVERGVITGLDLLGTPGMGSAFRSVPEALTTAGNYLTTQTPLRNTYRINPFRFRANPEAFYHRSPDLYNIIDETGGVLQGYGLSQAGKQAEQARQVSSGINLTKDPNTRLYFSKGVPLDWGRYNIKRRQDFRYELPRFSLDPLRQRYTNRQGYAGPFMVEVQGVPMGRSIKGRAPGKPPTSREAYATPYEPVPLDQAKFYKEDWLRGYKEIPRPKGEVKPFQSEINWADWNPDTPRYSELIDEYNAIEEATKKAGTWMKNPDGTPFQGPPELFIQTQSRNFKRAFPEGYNTVYRGTRGRNALPTTTSYDAETGKSTSALFSADEELARLYGFTGELSSSKLPLLTPQMVYSAKYPAGVFKLATPKVGNKNLSFPANRDSWTEVVLAGKNRATFEAALAQQKRMYDRIVNKPEFGPGHLANRQQQIAELEAILNNPEGIVSNLPEFQKMREALGDLTTTDRIAAYLETTDLPSIQLRNVNDGGLGDVTIINRKPGMYPKSLIGNVGFFDMTSPNVFKAAIPAVGGAAGYGLLQNSELGEFKSGGYQGGLRRWFKEKWVDVKTGKPCGRSGKEKTKRAYPYCRPSRKVSSKTPATSKHSEAKSRARQKTGPSRVKPISQRKKK